MSEIDLKIQDSRWEYPMASDLRIYINYFLDSPSDRITKWVKQHIKEHAKG